MLTRAKAGQCAELLQRNQQDATNPSFMKDRPVRRRIKDTISSASPISTRLRLGPRMPTGSRSRERAAPTLIQVRARNLQNRFNIFNDFKILILIKKNISF